MGEDDLFTRIQTHYGRLSGSRRRLAEYLSKHWDEAAFQSAAELGQAAGVSETVVIRFAGLIGYSGYPELKNELQEIVKRRLESVMVRRLESAGVPSEPADLLKITLDTSLTNVQRVMEQNLADTFVEAAQLCLGARFIYVCAMKASAGPARILATNLDQALANVRYITLDVGNMMDQLRGIGPEDLLITFSFVRYSLYTEQAARFARDRGAKHLAVTDDCLSPTGCLSSVTLLASTQSKWFGHSHTGTAAVIDLLLTLVGQLGEGRVRRSLGEIEELMAEYSPANWATRKAPHPLVGGAVKAQTASGLRGSQQTERSKNDASPDA